MSLGLDDVAFKALVRGCGRSFIQVHLKQPLKQPQWELL